MRASLILTVTGVDQPGLVEKLSKVVVAHEGGWQESRMARLAGMFAGIVHVVVPQENAESFISALDDLEADGLLVSATRGLEARAAGDFAELELELELVGSDRDGIVREISDVLARRGVSFDELNTECVDAPQAGGALFKARAMLRCPADVELDELRHELESLANDIMVDIRLDEDA